MTKPDPLTVKCSYCRAPSGEVCGVRGWNIRRVRPAVRPHKDRIRLAAEMAAHNDPALDMWPQLGPTSPCGLCGSGLPQRHRIVDAIVERLAAGEDREDVAGDYDLPMDAIRDLIEWDARWGLAGVR